MASLQQSPWALRLKKSGKVFCLRSIPFIHINAQGPDGELADSC